jgi:hypothetical protein
MYAVASVKSVLILPAAGSSRPVDAATAWRRAYGRACLRRVDRTARTGGRQDQYGLY